MKIDRLSLHNFGIYAQDHTLDLGSDKPVILIGGMNGRGKTTILEAILLALYGRRSFIFSENNRSFPKYLAGLVNKADGTYQSSVTLTFRVTAEGETDQFTVKRAWSLQTASPTLKTSVDKNGFFDPMLSLNWDMFIEKLLPCAIAPFFFFDGEKISELAVSDDDLPIKNSIKTLLGINVIDQAITDLQHIIKNKKKSVKTDDRTKEVALYDDQIRQADALVKKTNDELGVLTIKKNSIEKKLHEAENAYAAMGGHMAASKKDMTQALAAVNEKLEGINAKMIEMVAGDLPLLMVMPLLEEISEVAEAERNQRVIRDALAQLPVIYEQYNKNKKRITEFNDFLAYVRHTTSDAPPVYNLTENAYIQLKMLCATLSGNRKNEAQDLLTERGVLTAKKAELDNYLSYEVDEDESGKKYAEILTLTTELATTVEQHRTLKLSYDTYYAQYNELLRQRLKILDQITNAMDGADDTKRIITYAIRSIEVLLEYQKRLQAAKAHQLAQTITDCFKQIASKQNLLHEIRIDASTLDFYYINNDGVEINRASFSAGEKQLLVIAMLWALGICSKKQFPIIIDTPLARLDSEHRKALIVNYFPRASEQTILLSTDAEVHGRYYDTLKPFIGREYTLIYDDKTKQSTVRSGYFDAK